MSEWKPTTLGALCREGDGLIQTGPFGSQLHKHEYTSSGVAVAMPKDLFGGRLIYSTAAYISHEKSDQLSRHKLRPLDIVYARRGEIGRAAIMEAEDAPAICGTGCLLVRAPENGSVDKRFLSKVLLNRTSADWLSGQAVGATMPNLNTSILSGLPVCLPPLPIQKRIAGILSAYDDLIAVNERRIAILEEMARRVFETALVEQKLQKLHLRELISLKYGKALKASDRIQGAVPVYGSSGVVGFHNEALVPSGGLILGRKGNVGALHWSHVPFFPIDTVFYVESELPNSALFHVIQRVSFLTGDTAVPGLNREYALSVQVEVPSAMTMQKMSDKLEPLHESSTKLIVINTNLRATRDLLLPRLISGEIDVSEVPLPKTVAEE